MISSHYYIFVCWQELSIYPVWAYAASEASNDTIRSYTVSETSNATSKSYAVIVTSNATNSLIWSVNVIEQSNHIKSQVKPVMAQSTPMQSMTKATRKQIGTQCEVVRNSKHAVLLIHNLYVGQQAMSQDSKHKHCYPSVSGNFFQIQEVTRCNLTIWCQWTQWRCNSTICGQWKLNSRRRHKSTPSHNYRQANSKGTLSPK